MSFEYLDGGSVSGAEARRAACMMRLNSNSAVIGGSFRLREGHRRGAPPGAGQGYLRRRQGVSG